ncbi:MAG TPA: PilZ domain-containing protein [Tepidisphaeraceae bacterium]|nr:PilZ domain-containing protein [Tepidisphaeraceae bacterium]
MTPPPLPTDDVAALLASLEEAEGRERRRHPRTSTQNHTPATLRRSGSALIRVTIRDLSCSGAAVHTQSTMDVGEQVELTVEMPGKPPLRANCRVAACRLEADGRFVIGLEFLQISRAPSASSPAPQAGISTPTAPSTPTEISHAASVSERLEAFLSS